jgi:hypothetical protein
MTVVLPIRFRTADPHRREAIVRAARRHGARIATGPVDDVCEIVLDADDLPATARRALIAALDRDVPGWQVDATLYGG